MQFTMRSIVDTKATVAEDLHSVLENNHRFWVKERSDVKEPLSGKRSKTAVS